MLALQQDPIVVAMADQLARLPRCVVVNQRTGGPNGAICVTTEPEYRRRGGQLATPYPALAEAIAQLVTLRHPEEPHDDHTRCHPRRDDRGYGYRSHHW